MYMSDRSRSSPDPQRHLPLTPASLHILLALADGERHGYGIMREVEERTGGQLRLGPGTLYGSLKRMLGEGLIADAGERADPQWGDERRRYYAITALGRAVAAAEARRLDALVSLARSKRLIGPEPA
jgi:DNA-binding PadR family transcriptional regulator